MTTVSFNTQAIQRNWFVIDAENRVLGRLATEAARRLRGKHKPEFTPNADTGDFIVIINADKVRVTGNKAKGKLYYHHTGYPGGIKSTSFEDMQEKHPGRVVEKAIKGMLPKGPLGRDIYRKLKVYAGPEHPHEAQQPQLLENF